MLQTIRNAGDCREMYNGIKGGFSKNFLKRRNVQNIQFMKSKIVTLLKFSQTRFLERDIIVGAQVVNRHDRVAFIKQTLYGVIPNKPRSPGKKNLHVFTTNCFLCILLWRRSNKTRTIMLTFR